MSTKIEVKSPMTREVFDTYDVFCGWGQAADVCINLRRKMPHGELSTDPHFIGLDFNIEEAEALAKALLSAAEEARQWDKQVNDYFEALPPESEQENAGIKCDMLRGPCACGAWH